MHAHKTERYILLGLVGFFLAFSLTVDYRRAVGYFFGDEAVYYMMAQSIAFDRDLEYTVHDLERAYADGWHAGPLGIFLSKIDGGKIIYAKYPAYSLFLAPFLAIFGFNGFLVFNVLLWGAMIWMGWTYVRQFNASGQSLFLSITFFTLSASFIYTFWVTPETFNMFCVTCGLFLWLYKRDADSPTPTASLWPLSSGIQWLFGTSQGRVYLAPIPIAIATASKAPNILFLAPILADLLFVERSEHAGIAAAADRHLLSLRLTRVDMLTRIRKLLLIGLVTLLVIGSFYGFQYVMTGQTNAYAGDRKTFYGPFPFGSQGDAWERGIRLSNDDYYDESFFFHPKTFLYDLYYYVFGRFTGLFPYFFGTLIAGYYALRRLFQRNSSSIDRRMNWRRAFLGLTIVGSILGYILIAPTNYQGGGGAVGNRFFLNIYPAFLFLITTLTSLRPLAVNWIIGSLFLAQPLLTPFKTSFAPATHAFRFPYRFLPIERTLVDTLPTNVNNHLMQTALVDGAPSYRLYFCDENISDFTETGFWVQGQKDTELVVRTFAGQHYLTTTVINGPIPNRVTVWVAGQKRSVVLTAPGETRHLVFPLNNPVPFFHDAVYPMNVQSQTGFISTFTPGTDLNDLRYLGTWVSVSFSDAEAGRLYAEQGQTQEAIQVLTPVVSRQPQDAASRYALGNAYYQRGDIRKARQELDKSLSLLAEFQQTFIAGYNAQNPEHPLAEIPDLPSESSLQDILAPITVSYEAEKLLRGTGAVAHEPDASQAEAVLFDADIDEPGFLVYGQYINLPVGQYQVRVHFKTLPAAPSQAASSEIVAFNCDVYSQKYGIITQEKILLENAQSTQYQAYTFNFEQIRDTPLEFRVKTTGSTDVLIDKIDVYPLLPLNIYHTLALAHHAGGNSDIAVWFLQQVVAIDQWTPQFQDDYLTLLQEQQAPDKAQTFALTEPRLSRWHTGVASRLSDFAEIRNFRLLRFAPEIPTEYQFEDMLALIGYDQLPETVSSNDTVTMQLYWKALRDIEENLDFSVHVIKQGTWPGSELLARIQRKFGKSGILHVSFSYQPLDGAYPTGRWRVNEIIHDRQTFVLPSNLAPGTYAMWIELVHPLDGRAIRSGAAKRIQLGTFSVENYKD